MAPVATRAIMAITRLRAGGLGLRFLWIEAGAVLIRALLACSVEPERCGHDGYAGPGG